MSKFVAYILVLLAIFVPVSVLAKQTVFNETVVVERGDLGYGVSRFDDHEFKVTCWVNKIDRGGGISCLPWSQVKERVDQE